MIPVPSRIPGLRVGALRVSDLRLSTRDLHRGLIAGSLWGLATAAGLTALEAARCGGVCVDQALAVTGLSLALGLLGIGPVAALGGRTSRP